jgi:small subunit ribosomal protein S17
MMQNEQHRGRRKERTGFVISHAMQKTIIVKAERRVRHPLYGKEMRRVKKMHVHDEKDEAQVGDKVLIEETRPLSKLKRWRLVKVLQSANTANSGQA